LRTRFQQIPILLNVVTSLKLSNTQTLALQTPERAEHRVYCEDFRVFSPSGREMKPQSKTSSRSTLAAIRTSVLLLQIARQ